MQGEIVCVYEKDPQFLEFLENLELRPETRVEVKKREYDETMTLRSGNRTMHLGKPATSRIWVRRLRQRVSERRLNPYFKNLSCSGLVLRVGILRLLIGSASGLPVSFLGTHAEQQAVLNIEKWLGIMSASLRCRVCHRAHFAASSMSP